MTRWFVNKYVLGILVLLGAGFGAQKYWPVSADHEFTLGEAKKGDLIQRVTFPGGVVPKRKTLLIPPYAGYVHKIYVEMGQMVKTGDPIVSVAQSLNNPQEEIFPMRAPISGKVVQILHAEGEYVEAKQEDLLVRIDDLSQLYVEGTTPEIDFPKLKVGQEVIIKAAAITERTYKGKIENIFQAAKGQDKWERSKIEFPIKIKILDADESLKSGMSVVMDVITDQEKDVIMVRHEFIEKDDEKYFVVLADGTRKDIEVGLKNEEAFEVKSGLKAGEKIRQVDFLAMEKKHGRSKN